jgi:hypothetical protein
MNPEVLAKLPPANRVRSLAAQLSDLKNQIVYEFLYNPESIKRSRRANYAELQIPLRPVPVQQYMGASGTTLDLSNLLLSSYSAGKSLRPLLDSLNALLVTDPDNKVYAPTLLQFVWGSQRFYPCVLTSLSSTATLWLGGEVAEARVDMTLLEIPPVEDVKVIAPIAPLTSPQSLTTRQMADSTAQATTWITGHLGTLPQAAREAFRLKRYRISTNPDGIIRMLDPSGSQLAVLDFKPS